MFHLHYSNHSLLIHLILQLLKSDRKTKKKKRGSRWEGKEAGTLSASCKEASCKVSPRDHICHTPLDSCPGSSPSPVGDEGNKAVFAEQSPSSYWTLFNPWHNMASLLKLIKNKWQDVPPKRWTVHLHSAFQSASLQGDRAKYGP